MDQGLNLVDGGHVAGSHPTADREVRTTLGLVLLGRHTVLIFLADLPQAWLEKQTHLLFLSTGGSGSSFTRWIGIAKIGR